MAKKRFRDFDFGPEALATIEKMVAILGEYEGRVSVRQLYYQFVARDIIPNSQREYRRIQELTGRARLAGMIDWNHIIDRNRAPERSAHWASGRAALDEAAESFRLNRWRGQPFYVELWVEKAALADILWPIASEFHAVMMVNRGYSSLSAMKESADRIRHHSRGDGGTFGADAARPVVLYLGDHDPSGEDMVRDISERLREFGCPPWLDVRKVALTMEQVEKYNPPPNPAKLSDSRAKGYIEKHGDSSWEVDALPPDDLEDLIINTLVAYIDKPKMDAVISEENEIKTRLKMIARQMSQREDRSMPKIGLDDKAKEVLEAVKVALGPAISSMDVRAEMVEAANAAAEQVIAVALAEVALDTEESVREEIARLRSEQS